ncbi:MAG: sulfite exporter TauE/SafE family protein [Nanoarchaeota archaeon]|nr:sulfite exporter TauE/SafE family protein [Nanoarchaeota archaeon]
MNKILKFFLKKEEQERIEAEEMAHKSVDASAKHPGNASKSKKELLEELKERFLNEDISAEEYNLKREKIEGSHTITQEHKKEIKSLNLKIRGMHCNSCASLIEKNLKDRVEKVSVSYSDENAKIDFRDNKISEKEIFDEIGKLGYHVKIIDESKHDHAEKNEESNIRSMFWIGGAILGLIAIYYALSTNSLLPEIALPQIGQNASLLLIFAVGLLTGFHCISMCGGFVVSYTTKNALRGHKSLKQHLVYGGSKVLSYSVIGFLFGLIGGIFSFSTKLRGTIGILAGIFMVFYALSMMGIGFFRKFQFNPKFLTNIATKSHSGPFKGPMLTGLLNGLFIACGPLQAMYLYAAGTGSAMQGALALAVFGLGTLPVMFGFGSLTTLISHKTTTKILKIAAIIVLILGLITLNRGLALAGTFNFDSIKDSLIGSTAGIAAGSSTIINGVQEINMDVTSSGWSPNIFTLKKGVPVKWNINVKQLTGCNNEIIVNDYGLDVKLKEGLNVVEFTPDKSGTVRWSCWVDCSGRHFEGKFQGGH